jgi:hypothetical protein
MRFLLVLALVIPACGGLRPKPPDPPRSVPVLAMEPPPPVEGQGRIAIDAVGVGGVPGPYWVELSVAESANVRLTVSSHVCKQTPCVANLPYGEHLLRIGNNRERFGYVAVTIGTKPTILNVVVGCWKGGMFSPCFQDPSYVQWEPVDGQIYTRQ